MFFKLAKTSGNLAKEAQKTIDLQREDVKKKLQMIDEVNTKLAEAVRQTQEISSSLSEKVNRELKIARKSLTSISSKLKEGLMMVDYNGHITHLNKTATKILGITEAQAVGKYLEDFIECSNIAFDGDGKVVQKPILMRHFFKELSVKIFEKLASNPTCEKYIICNKALQEEIPFCFESDLDTVLGVKIVCNGKPLSLTVTLTVLDNDPECIKDVSYVFLFNDH